MLKNDQNGKICYVYFTMKQTQKKKNQRSVKIWNFFFLPAKFTSTLTYIRGAQLRVPG